LNVGTNNFGTLTFTGGTVNISEASGTTLSGVSNADSLTLTSAGTLTNDATADVAVANNASLSGTSIDLNTTTPAVALNFGSLGFNSAGAVKIAETSSTTLSGVSTADSLVLSSTGALTNDATADVAVTNNDNLSGTSIDMNTTTQAVAVNFGTVTFNSAGAVKSAE